MESRELAFFGKIAAGVTHELRNVLAIINESNGLTSDLMAMSKTVPFPHRDRLLKSVEKIDKQVRRGVELTGVFNRFSHSMDNPEANVDLSEIVGLTIALAQRFARLKNVELIDSPCANPVMLLTHPFRLQMALTKAIDGCVAAMNCAGAIVLQVGEEAGAPYLDMRCEMAPGQNIDLKEAVYAFGVWDEFEKLAAALNAGIEWKATEAFRIYFAKGANAVLSK